MLMETSHTDKELEKTVTDFLARVEKDIHSSSGGICTPWGDILRDCADHPMLVKELVEKQIKYSGILYAFPHLWGRDLMDRAIGICRKNRQSDLAKRLNKQCELLASGASKEEIEAARAEIRPRRPVLPRRLAGFLKHRR